MSLFQSNNLKFAKTNQKFAENSEFCEKKFTIIQNYSLHSLGSQEGPAVGRGADPPAREPRRGVHPRARDPAASRSPPVKF